MTVFLVHSIISPILYWSSFFRNDFHIFFHTQALCFFFFILFLTFLLRSHPDSFSFVYFSSSLSLSLSLYLSHVHTHPSGLVPKFPREGKERFKGSVWWMERGAVEARLEHNLRVFVTGPNGS